MDLCKYIIIITYYFWSVNCEHQTWNGIHFICSMSMNFGNGMTDFVSIFNHCSLFIQNDYQQMINANWAKYISIQINKINGSGDTVTFHIVQVSAHYFYQIAYKHPILFNCFKIKKYVYLYI